MKKKLPVLFVIFNRPEIAYESFQAIKRYRPDYLYIAADGARENKEEEALLCEMTRSIILKEIDWDCEVNTLFREKNIGCGQGVFTAINWFFENEEQGIILEDDCIADASFFSYTEELIFRFKNDLRIGMISGYNPTNVPIKDSYCFSKYIYSCWGWATWRRAWKNMDIDMNWRDTEFHWSIIKNMGFGGKGTTHWKRILQYIDNQIVSAWDFQWIFTLSFQNQLIIFPKNNLITNIGFGINSTHNQNNNYKGERNVFKSIEFPLEHPAYILPFLPFEKSYWQERNRLYFKIKNLIPVKTLKQFKKMKLNSVL